MASFASPQRSEFLLKVQKVIRVDSIIFKALGNNDIKVVKELLASGEVSVNDIAENGQSPLLVGKILLGHAFNSGVLLGILTVSDSIFSQHLPVEQYILICSKP